MTAQLLPHTAPFPRPSRTPPSRPTPNSSRKRPVCPCVSRVHASNTPKTRRYTRPQAKTACEKHTQPSAAPTSTYDRRTRRQTPHHRAQIRLLYRRTARSRHRHRPSRFASQTLAIRRPTKPDARSNRPQEAAARDETKASRPRRFQPDSRRPLVDPSASASTSWILLAETRGTRQACGSEPTPDDTMHLPPELDVDDAISRTGTRSNASDPAAASRRHSDASRPQGRPPPTPSPQSRYDAPPSRNTPSEAQNDCMCAGAE